MGALIGALVSGIAFLIGEAIGSLIGGLVGVIFELIVGIITMITGIISLFWPNFSLRQFPIKNPTETYEQAKPAVRSFKYVFDAIASDLQLIFFLPFDIQEYRSGCKRFKQLAEMDYPHCAAIVGKIYKDGAGGFRHNKKAAIWLQKAIDDNDISYDNVYEGDARIDLAELYLYGKGVEQDFEKALSLIEKCRETDKVKDIRFLANWKLKKLHK